VAQAEALAPQVHRSGDACQIVHGGKTAGATMSYVMESEPVPGTPVVSPAPKDEAEPMLYCPVCSTRLAERKCKLFCQKCGYYLSCADYY
jgi:hypothetical protein